MDQKDEFKKWLSSVEEALSGKTSKVEEDILEQGSCGCGAWDCQECFPDTEGNLPSGTPIPAVIIIGGEADMPGAEQEVGPEQGIGMAGTHPVGPDTFDHSEEDEIDVTTLAPTGVDDEYEFSMDEEDESSELVQDRTPRSGKGVKLGDIVQKYVPATNASGEESPMSYGEDNLDEDGADVDTQEMIDKISYMQDMGLSKGSQHYSPEELAMLPVEKLKAIQQEVIGGVSEETNKPKPTKTKPFDPDLELDGDFLNPRAAHPIVPANDDGEYNDTIDGPEQTQTPHMPRASAADTRARTANINPSATMRDYMNRIDPNAGGDEPELADDPQDQDNALVARTAADVPAAISNAMTVAGVEIPEWHTVNNLPGFRQRNIRGMGRQIFGMFTRTPLEQIQTIANVDGQGPNTDAELRSVANWLINNAEDLGDVDLSHGQAIPGYKPDVKEYRINGVRFHVVRDPMGQYIYAYPDSDATLNTNNAQIGHSAPRLREGQQMAYSLSISEAIKFDEIVKEGLTLISESSELEESSLSKLIGKQKGGQALVRWLHREHKLSNEAELEPVPFDKELLNTQFKSHPDDFVIVSASNGVAGIKPSEKHIKQREEEYRKAGKTYNPAGDSTLPYQIIAFTDDGQQVDPRLLKPEQKSEKEKVKQRMGKLKGADLQNPDNIFALLQQQIGKLRTVWISGWRGFRGDPESIKPSTGSVERGKIQQRAERNAPPKDMPEDQAVTAIFKRVRPVLKKLAAQAESTIKRRIQRYNDGGNYEGAQKLAGAAVKLRQFLATIDTSNDINIDTGWGSSTRDFSQQVKRALSAAANAPIGSEEYNQYLNAAARGNAVALKPILDAFRDSLVALQ